MHYQGTERLSSHLLLPEGAEPAALARLAELLLLWRHGAPDHREVVYLAHHIAAERQLWVGHEDGGVR